MQPQGAIQWQKVDKKNDGKQVGENSQPPSIYWLYSLRCKMEWQATG